MSEGQWDNEGRVVKIGGCRVAKVYMWVGSDTGSLKQDLPLYLAQSGFALSHWNESY